jgi:branched-chain amino acid transport system substrate-binding protein
MAALAAAAICPAAWASDSGIKIGVLNDQSGLYTDIGGPGSVTAARMAVEDFGGTILGKPIEVVFADHQNKADIGSSIARRWIENEKVDVIADVPNSSVALAVQGVTRQLKRIFIISGASSTDLTGKECSPYGFHWTFDTYALARGTGGAMVKQGGDTWFFITADYAFGHSLEQNTAAVVKAAGGKVLGAVRAPLDTPDFSSFLLQAQASQSKVIGLANAGGDTINAIKQASEFGIVQGGQKLAGLLVFISDINSLGLRTAQGLVVTESFYWDLNDNTRAWSRKFMERNAGKAPTMVQAGVYGGVLHYLKAVQAANTDNPDTVAAKMREIPVNDFYTKDVRIRADNRVMRDFYLFEVKRPEESNYPWDDYKLLATIPADEAARPLNEGGCPFVKE